MFFQTYETLILRDNEEFQFSFIINNKGEYILPVDYDIGGRDGNFILLDKWLLKTSRLLNHFEARCLKHPMYK